MTKRRLILAVGVLLTGALIGIPRQSADAQSRTVAPERRLLGISLGRDQLEVLRRFGRPNEIQTVALAVPGDNLPGLGGGGSIGSEGGLSGLGGYPGMGGGSSMPGGYPGMSGGSPYGGSPFGSRPPGGLGGGSSFGGGAAGGAGVLGPPTGASGGTGGGASGGAGVLGPPGGGGGSPYGVPSLPPGGSGFGDPGLGGLGGSGGGGPEFSNAVLWIFKRPNNVRLEFLINEDGRVAQISVAAPAGRSYPGSQTARGIGIGSDFSRVIAAYGNPERHRLLPGLRFYEAYYTKNYHAAFTFDTSPRGGMKVARITIALAD